MNSAQQPLTGTRVLDFTRQLAGPFATSVLGDFGADVIKVDSMPYGDPARRLWTAAESHDADSAAFQIYNHGKRSIVIDLRAEEGVQLVKQMAVAVDVVVENYRPGVADEIGIGFRALREVNPRLIYCSISAFGQEGPWARQPATDPVVQAMSGLVHVTGHPGDPMRAGVPIADVVGAMCCVQGVLLALLARTATGVGQWVDISLLHALMLANTTRLAELISTGEEPGGQGTSHSLVAPYQVFETADGLVIAGSWTEDTWPRLSAAIGMPELLDDPRFQNNVLRIKNREELAAIIGAVLRQKSTAEWEVRFHAHRAMFGPVLPISEAIRHVQVEGRPAVRELPHPDLGSVVVPDPPSAIRLHGTPGEVTRPAPRLGEHAAEILETFGFTSREVQDLARAGVIGEASEIYEGAG